jgi:hypothetical protein
MIKIGDVPEGKDPLEYTVIERETQYQDRGRPICVALQRGSIQIWRKGKRETFSVQYDTLLHWCETATVSIKPRR